MTQSAAARGTLRVALAQCSARVGDVHGNAAQIIAVAKQARDDSRADVVVFPELALLGYPPDDLLQRPALPAAVAAALLELQQQLYGITAVFGYPEFADDGWYSAVLVLRDGQRMANYRKQCLADDGAFDDRPYFRAGQQTCVFDHNGWQLGLTIGADIRQPGPAARAGAAGADLLLNLNASPFHVGKQAEREAVVSQRARISKLPVCCVNCVGGQDELVFDGASFALDAQGQTVMRAPACAEGLYCVDWPTGQQASKQAGPAVSGPASASAEQQVYAALVMATRDYVTRNGFPGVVLGASGGIDSALVMAIAADAIGGGHVHAVALPSRYTAAISNADALEQARRLEVHYDELPIESAFAAALDTLVPVFGELPVDVTEENLQARIRGTLLMALSNKFGSLLLATGNKSEAAVGYSTLYGDMCGGFAPIKDVYKTWVYRLANYRNSLSAVIPQRVITRPPSAELRADQADSDSLPDYATLDAIIRAYVEDGAGVAKITEQGFDATTVARVATLIRRSEYKRQQAAPGPKVTPLAFGRERRFPITASWEPL